MAGVLVAIFLVVATASALGPPELTVALSFVGGDRPTAGGELAAAVLILWVMVAAVAVTAVVAMLRRGRVTAYLRRRSVRAAVAAGLGVVALAAGALHHRSGTYSMCCGGTDTRMEEARELIH